jgi:hypothetical protein
MHEVQKIAITRALRTLAAAQEHIEFAAEFDGQTYGNRELKPKKEPKRKTHYPYGETRKHYLPYFENAKVGDVIEIPFDRFDPGILASNVSAACVNRFGKGSVTVHQNKTTGMLEVMIENLPETNDAQDELFA